MISLNPFDYWYSNNKIKVCLGDAEDLSINANHLASGNIFSHQPVKANGVEIGYYKVNEVSPNLQTYLTLYVPQKFQIPEDSKVEVVKNNHCNYYNSNNAHLEIVLGNSSVYLGDNSSILGTCPIKNPNELFVPNTHKPVNI